MPCVDLPHAALEIPREEVQKALPIVRSDHWDLYLSLLAQQEI